MQPSLNLVDTHCHLNLPQLSNQIDNLLIEANRNGVQKVIVPGIDMQTSKLAVEIAEQHPAIYAAVGYHPHAASTWNAFSEKELLKLAEKDCVVAIGEIGLDYYRNLSIPVEQRQVFDKQLQLAAAINKPVIIHSRDAIQDCVGILNKWANKAGIILGNNKGVLHAYAGDLDSARLVIDDGFYIGVAGPVTYKNANQRREITRNLPLDRLLSETDAPYLAPHPNRGKLNRPAWVRIIADQIAVLFDQSLENTAAILTKNAEQLFGLEHGRKTTQLL